MAERRDKRSAQAGKRKANASVAKKAAALKVAAAAAAAAPSAAPAPVTVNIDFPGRAFPGMARNPRSSKNLMGHEKTSLASNLYHHTHFQIYDL